jgi:hypothetical protein
VTCISFLDHVELFSAAKGAAQRYQWSASEGNFLLEDAGDVMISQVDHQAVMSPALIGGLALQSK